jgi:hypothetical protein
MRGKRIKSIVYAGKTSTFDLVVHNKNHNFLLESGLVSHNSGKSFAVLKIAETLDPTFNIHRVCFTVKEFVDIIKDPNLASGSVVVFDEISVAHSNRNWFTAQNKILNAIHQIFRYRNLIVLYTCPDFSFIDTQTRKLFHMMIETQHINYQNKTCILKPHWISVSKMKGNIYYPYPRFKTPDGLIRLKYIRVGMPSHKLIVKYEEKKRAYGSNLLESADKMIGKLEDKEDAFKYRKPLNELEQKVYNYRKEGKSNMEIGMLMNIQNSAIISGWVQVIKKKGWTDVIEKKPKIVIDPYDDPNVLV